MRQALGAMKTEKKKATEKYKSLLGYFADREIDSNEIQFQVSIHMGNFIRENGIMLAKQSKTFCFSFKGVGWRLSYVGHTADALALRGEEGRCRLR